MTTNRQVSIAFSGSGFLAPIHAGAAAAVLDAGCEIVEAAGTSGGSIVAAAVGLGMNSAQLKSLGMNTSFKGLTSPDFFGIIDNMALSSGHALLELLQSLFPNKTMKDAQMPLQIVSTHVEAGASYIFAPDTDADTQISLACRASASVPFLYAPVKYRGMTLVDGGVINNIPVDRLQSKSSIKIGIDVAEGSSYSASNAFKFASSLIGMLLSANENSHEALGQMTGAHILAVPTNDWFLNTDLTEGQRAQLFQAGYDHVSQFLHSQS